MASLRLICVPYAGAGISAFRGWGRDLPATVEAYVLQLPGREDRLGEKPYEGWAPMRSAAAEALGAWPRLPVALFGHSLGAVIALDLARWLHRSRPGALRHLFLAGRPWPGVASGERSDWLALDDESFVSAVEGRYGAVSNSLSHPEIRDLTLPALRADLRLLDSYHYDRSAVLDSPLTVYGGRNDPVTPAPKLEAWRQETSGPFELRWLDAGHFFIETHRAELLADISARLSSAAL